MSRRKILLCAALACAFGTGCGGKESAPSAPAGKESGPATGKDDDEKAGPLEPGTLRLSAEQQQAVRIEVRPLRPGRLPETVKVTGVLDYIRESPLVAVAAPAAGTVSRVLAAVGDSVQPGQPLLEIGGRPVAAPDYGAVADLQASAGASVREGQNVASLLSTSRLAAYLDVREGQLAKVRAGQEAEVRVLSMPEASFEGKISSFSPQMDPQTRVVTARVELDNKRGLLRPGMAVEAAVQVPGTRARLAVPASAVLYDASGGAWVYVREGEDLFTRRRVDLASSSPTGLRAVERGLEPGELVVVRGAQELWGKEFSSGVKVGDDEDQEGGD